VTRRHARGPVLSSVVMVGLATAATGLLALAGLQGLPEGVLQSNFGGHESRTPRQVDVTPAPTPHRTPPPAPPSPATTTGPPRHTARVPRATAPARPVTTADPKPTPKPAPSPRPTPSPTCTKKSGKCHGGPKVSPYGMSSYGNEAAPKPGRRARAHGHKTLG